MTISIVSKGSPACNAEVIIQEDPNSKTRCLVTCPGCSLKYTAAKL